MRANRALAFSHTSRRIHTNENSFLRLMFFSLVATVGNLSLSLSFFSLSSSDQRSWRCFFCFFFFFFFFFFGPFPEVSLNRRPRYLTDERILVSEALIITTLLRSPDNRLWWWWSGDRRESWRRRIRNSSLVSFPTINARRYYDLFFALFWCLTSRVVQLPFCTESDPDTHRPISMDYLWIRSLLFIISSYC